MFFNPIKMEPPASPIIVVDDISNDSSDCIKREVPFPVIVHGDQENGEYVNIKPLIGFGISGEPNIFKRSSAESPSGSQRGSPVPDPFDRDSPESPSPSQQGSPVWIIMDEYEADAVVEIEEEIGEQQQQQQQGIADDEGVANDEGVADTDDDADSGFWSEVETVENVHDDGADADYIPSKYKYFYLLIY